MLSRLMLNVDGINHLKFSGSMESRLRDSAEMFESSDPAHDGLNLEHICVLPIFVLITAFSP